MERHRHRGSERTDKLSGAKESSTISSDRVDGRGGIVGAAAIGPQRVMIVGSGGAGKSTLAVQLGDLLGLPVVHLDREFWNDGWVPTPRDPWLARQQELVAAEQWVIDGNYGGSLDIRLHRADLVVFLDLPRRVTIPAALVRSVRWHGRTRPNMHPGCPS